jgi:hypothetical protein
MSLPPTRLELSPDFGGCVTKLSAMQTRTILLIFVPELMHLAHSIAVVAIIFVSSSKLSGPIHDLFLHRIANLIQILPHTSVANPTMLLRITICQSLDSV